MARKRRRAAQPTRGNIERLAYGGATLQTKRGQQWFVRNISADRAEKIYRCPACTHDIDVGQAHVVVWREDHLLGDARAVEERRHWHNHCWRIS